MGIKQYLAKDFMSKDIISVSADINIHDLVKIFVEHPVSALPVVGEKYITRNYIGRRFTL